MHTYWLKQPDVQVEEFENGQIICKLLNIGSVWNQETNTVQFMISEPLDPGMMPQFEFLQHLFSQGEKWIAEHPEQWFWDYLIES